MLRACREHFRVQIVIQLLINRSSSSSFNWALHCVRGVIICQQNLGIDDINILGDISWMSVLLRTRWFFKAFLSFISISLRIAKRTFFFDIFHHFIILCQNLRGYIWSCRFNWVLCIKRRNLWHLKIIKILHKVKFVFFDFHNVLLQFSVSQGCLVSVNVKAIIQFSLSIFNFILFGDLDWHCVLFDNNRLHSFMLRF